MPAYITHGDSIIYNPVAGVATVTATAPVKIIVTNNKGLTTAVAKDLATKKDLVNTKVSATYITSAGFVGGTGVLSLTNWSKISTKTLRKEKGLLVQGGTGTYKLTVITPAVNPSGVVDPIISYLGSFSVTTTQSVFTEK